MTRRKFNKLKVGDKVTLAVDLDGYHDMLRWKDTEGHPLRREVPAGTEGVVGSVKVPSIYGTHGPYFVCVDFPDNPINYKCGFGPTFVVQRVAAHDKDLV